jgi:hypothetical protein
LTTFPARLFCFLLRSKGIYNQKEKADKSVEKSFAKTFFNQEIRRRRTIRKNENGGR